MDQRVYMFTFIAFIVGMSELIVSGILDLIAAGLNVRISTAGLLITVFAVFYGISAPILLVLCRAVERKTLILIALVLFLFGNVLAVFSFSFPMLLAARMTAAASGSVATVLSINLASRIVDPAHRGRAIGIVVMGISGSLVLGLPIGVFLGNYINWRAPFVLIAIFSIVLIVFTYKKFGNIEPSQVATLHEQVRTLKNARVLCSHLTTFFFLAGHLTLNGYLTPYVKSVMGYDGIAVSFMYLTFGAAAVFGSWLSGMSADRFGVKRTLFFNIIVLTLCLFFIPFTKGIDVLFWLVLIVWGVVSWGITPPIQSHLFTIAKNTADVQQSLNNAALHLGIAFGTLFGGFVIDIRSLEALPHAGIMLIFIAFGIATVATRDLKSKISMAKS